MFKLGLQSSETKRTTPLCEVTVASGRRGKNRHAEAEEMHVSKARDGGASPNHSEMEKKSGEQGGS